jgi:hypothetical protein
MDCIRSVRNYHISKNEAISGQVIYMDRGIQYFPLLKEYLIKELGYGENEIGIIQSGLPKNGKRSKDYVKNLFNGEIYNEETKEFELVSDSERLKIVIGSSTIKEGLNLQKFGTVLYNCSVDWNPTDMQQLSGRIHRQKNNFGAVRIVIPLLINSADIFLFQKLQEKSSRLHSIWSTNNLTNKIETGDLNTAEVKYALIRNPEKIAKLKIAEEEEYLNEELLLFTKQLNNANLLNNTIYKLNNYYDKVKEKILPYRKFKEGDDTYKNYMKLASLIRDAIKRNNIDAEGMKIYESWEWDRIPYYSKYDTPRSMIRYKYYPNNEAREFLEYSKYYKSFKENIIKDYFPSLDENNYYILIDDYKAKIESDIRVITDKMQYLKTDDYLARITNEVIEMKAKNQLAYKSISELVAGFSSLNYLLSDKKVKEGKKVDITPVEVVETIIKQPIAEVIEEEIVSSISKIEKRIKTLEISLKFANGDNKLKLEKRIKTLKISLKYGK